MISIKPITPELAFTWKRLRLAALKDTPLAFGSTYARESQFSDAEWIDRATQWNGGTRVGYIAFDGDRPCGIAGGFLTEENPAIVYLFSMWIAATHRGTGVGRSLVEAIITWAKSRNARELTLMVTSSNEGAQRFYDRLGFVRTGREEPYPNQAGLVEYEMSLTF